MVLSSKLSNDASSELADRVIEGVRSTIQQAAVRVSSMGTQTFSPPATSRAQQSAVSDQAVPAEPTMAYCTERSLCEDVCKPLIETDGSMSSTNVIPPNAVCNSRTHNTECEVRRETSVVTQVGGLDTNSKITAVGNANVCGE